MDLLERVFGFDLACPRYHGPMHIIQVVEDPLVIERILTYLASRSTRSTVSVTAPKSCSTLPHKTKGRFQSRT